MRMGAFGVAWLLAAGCGGEAHYVPPGVDAGGSEDAAAGSDAGPDAAAADGGLDAGVDSGCHDDVDQDGIDSPACGGRDCNDQDPTIGPRADDPGEWLFERADELGWATAPAVAVGADGVPHVLFEDRTLRAVVHAVRAAEEEWTRDVLEEAGRGPALVVGADGRLHAVFAGQGGELRHAVSVEGGAWEIGTAVAGALDHELVRPALAAGEDGALVAAWGELGADPDGAAVRVALADVEEGGPWADEDVAGERADGRVAVALAPDGTPWIAWDHADAVSVASRTDGTWAVEVLELAAAAGAPSLAVGPAGEVVVPYQERTTGSLHVARRGPETWSTELVDDRAGAGLQSAITLDPAGVAHLVYHVSASFDARWATDAYGDWLRVTLDRSAEADVAVTLDAAGGVHMAYGTSDSDLRWSHHVMGDGIDQDCDGTPDDG